MHQVSTPKVQVRLDNTEKQLIPNKITSTESQSNRITKKKLSKGKKMGYEQRKKIKFSRKNLPKTIWIICKNFLRQRKT